MARANNGGWDFVKVGETYQYKEGGWFAEVTVLEDNSDEEYYDFLLRIERCTGGEPPETVFPLKHYKHADGYWSGMSQLFEVPEYMCDYNWHREPSPKTT